MSAAAPPTGDVAGRRRVRLLVSGHVQGVFYRVTTRERARALGVAGHARNLPDGRVEVVAEGDAARIEALVGFCRQGPAGARVKAVEVEELAPTGGGGGEFDIR